MEVEEPGNAWLEGSKYSILRVMYTCSKVVGGGEPEMLVECSEW